MIVRTRTTVIRTIATIAILVGCMHGHPALAQQRADSVSLAVIAVRLSDRYGATVLIDPALVVLGDAVHLDITKGIEATLDQLTNRLPNSTWRRVYMTEGLAPNGAAKLAASARVLDHIAIMSIALDNISPRRVTLLEKDVPMGSQFSAMLQKKHFRTKPMYLVYNTAAVGDGMDPEERFLEGQRELDSLLEVDPDLRTSVMEQSMLWWTRLDAATQKLFMEKMAQSGTRAWQSADPSQRQQMMQQFMQSAQRAAADTAAPRVPNSTPERAEVTQNYRAELVRLAARLSKQYKVESAVDTAIYLTIRPQSPRETEDIRAALTELMTPLKGTEWRRVTLRMPPDAPPLQPAKLADIARFLDRLGPADLILEDSHTGRATVYEKSRSATEFETVPDTSLVYLLYASYAAGVGRSVDPATRIAELLQGQQQMMLSMDSGQLAEAMGRGVQDWRNTDGAGRERAMNLPLMAGLMATWLPIEAKERAGK